MPNWMGMGSAISSGLGNLGRAGIGVARSAWANPYGRAGVIGGGLGAIYGGFSDNTSVLGGMVKGAGLGIGARAGYGMGRAGMGMYNLSRGMGMSKGQAAWQAMAGIGRGSAAFIGSTARRAYNPISSTLKGYLPRILPSG